MPVPASFGFLPRTRIMAGAEGRRIRCKARSISVIDGRADGSTCDSGRPAGGVSRVVLAY